MSVLPGTYDVPCCGTPRIAPKRSGIFTVVPDRIHWGGSLVIGSGAASIADVDRVTLTLPP